MNATTRTNGPADSTEVELLTLVHPPTWSNPEPPAMYDLVVIGGGTAGLVCAVGAGGLGARVALVEKNLLGGDCLNTGCVPSKALLRSARAIGELRRGAQLGVGAEARAADFPVVMDRMRRRRAEIARNDSAERLQSLGIDVYFGGAHFVSDRSVAVEGQELRFQRAVIATGGRPTAPPIRGLADVPFLTNETIFSLAELPERLLVIGGGPIGCELAQAFARFGSRVTLFDQATQVLPHEDRDAAAIVQRSLERDGVRFELGVSLTQVERADGNLRAFYSRNGNREMSNDSVDGSAILVAAGRAPNIEDLELGTAGIQANQQGVVVNDRLQTTNRRVYASGDVCSQFKFTHAADALSRIVLQNALFFGRRKASSLVMPWVTYTDPEVAHVGVSASDLRDSRAGVQAITIPLCDIDRAVVDDETDGFVRVYHDRGRVCGCTIVAPHAGDMIGQVTYAMQRGATLADFSATIQPYPTIGEGLRKAGDAYRRQSLTPMVRKALQRYFAWTR
jgi:pyruvate/2-oxoglutarate dehydrogenase complex dihydrolipoamide dehydrogenase (E3) component